MTRELDWSVPRIRFGQVKVYLGETSVADVRRCRELFGGVVLHGKSGLRIATTLSQMSDLDGIEFDPAMYLSREISHPAQHTLFTDQSSQDLVRQQHDLGLAVVRSAGRRIRVGRADDLQAALAVSYSFDVSAVLPLDGGWFGPRHLDTLCRELVAADRDVTIVPAAPFDPFDRASAIAGLRQVISWAKSASRRMDLWRTDLVGIPAVIDGAASTAIGLSTSTRHFGLPLGGKRQQDFNERQHSPLVFVPKLLHWQRGNVLGALSAWRSLGLTACACAACADAGEDLLRFDMVYRTQPAVVRHALQAHTLHAIGDLVRELRSEADPRLALKLRRRTAAETTRSTVERTKVPLDGPPAWITSWD